MEKEVACYFDGTSLFSLIFPLIYSGFFFSLILTKKHYIFHNSRVFNIVYIHNTETLI